MKHVVFSVFMSFLISVPLTAAEKEGLSADFEKGCRKIEKEVANHTPVLAVMRREAEKLAKKYGEKAVPFFKKMALKKVLETDYAEDERTIPELAIFTLGSIGTETAVDALIEIALNNPRILEEDIAFFVTTVLVNIGDNVTKKSFERIIVHKKAPEWTQYYALEALVAFGDRETLKLIKETKFEEESVTEAAKRVVSLLEKRLGLKNEKQRKEWAHYEKVIVRATLKAENEAGSNIRYTERFSVAAKIIHNTCPKIPFEFLEYRIKTGHTEDIYICSFLFALQKDSRAIPLIRIYLDNKSPAMMPKGLIKSISTIGGRVFLHVGRKKVQNCSKTWREKKAIKL